MLTELGFKMLNTCFSKDRLSDMLFDIQTIMMMKDL